jgi:hypothetical protein
MVAHKGLTLRLDEIQIPASWRPYNAEAVVNLKGSIALIGLQSAPTVVEREGRYVLVAGRHRIEALKLLGHQTVLARVVDMDDRDARLWTISENLHRAELTVSQRAEQVTEFLKLSEEKRAAEKPVQVGHVSGGRGNEGGISAAARDLGMTRHEVRRAQTIAALPEETKIVARNLRLDDNQSALIRAAKAPTPEEQYIVLNTIASSGGVAGARRANSEDYEVVQIRGTGAKPLHNLRYVAAGELALWVKRTTPDDRTHVIRVLREAADILEDELEGRE